MSQEKNFTTKIVTNECVLHFPHLFRVNDNNKNGNRVPKYGTTIIVDKSDVETLDKMYYAIKNAAELGGIADEAEFKSPLNDGDIVHPGENLYKNSMYLYASSSLPPRVVDHKVEDIKFRRDEFPSGTIAKVSLEFVPYKFNGKCGVSTVLVNVQILPKNKLMDYRSKPEDDFVVEAVDEE